MKHSLTLLLVTALLAASRAQEPPVAPGATANPPLPSGKSLLRLAAQAIHRQPSFRADLRQQVNLFGQCLVGSGTYLHKQTSRGLLVRLDCEIPLAERVASMQQFCDGRFLWIRRDFSEPPTLERVDLDRLGAMLDPEAANGQSQSADQTLMTVGLPRLLLGLSESFEFDAPRAARLGDLPVWVVQGVWSRPQRESPEEQADVLPHQAMLLPHVPTHVRVVIAQQNSLPQRIEYLRRIDEHSHGDSGERVTQTLAVLDILDVACGIPLDDELFRCEPGRQEILDRTDRYLQSLRATRAP